MKTSPISSPSRWFAPAFARCGILLMLATAVRAGLPEPDAVFYGAVALDGVFVTAADHDVQVQLRHAPDGPPVAVYTMGDKASAGDRYVLRAAVESSAPLINAAAVPIGGTVHLVVVQNGQVRDAASQVITARGRFIEVNFGDVDTDGDGMSDSFERQYFGSNTAGNPNLDSDNDGRPNLREFQQGTNPLVADGRHPADLQPADWALNIQEVTEYALAWKLGQAWTVEPKTIPMSYVTRASALWVGGETYLFDNDPVVGAPLWWVNGPAPAGNAAVASAPAADGESGEAALADGFTEEERLRARLVADAREALRAGSGGRAAAVASEGPESASIERRVPSRFARFAPFTVTVNVTPKAGTKAYAVEENPPPGWIVRYVSGEGRVDTTLGTIKWGPFYGEQPRTLTYELTPMDEPASVDFAGAGSFDGSDVDASGRLRIYGPGVAIPSTLTVARHAAEGDLVIDLEGEPNTTPTVQASGDLIRWVDLDPVTLDAAGRGRVFVPAGEEARFFRLQPAP